MGFKRKKREVDVGLKVRGGGKWIWEYFGIIGGGRTGQERKTGGVKHDREKVGYLFSGILHGTP